MISNTSCSELKLVDNVGFLSGEFKQMFQFSTSTPVNNNNNSDIPKNKNMSTTPTALQLQSTKPFTFYTSGGVGVVGDTPTTESVNLIIQRNLSDSTAKRLKSPIVIQSNEIINYDPCSYYNLKQENELTTKIITKFHNDSALNDDVGNDGGISGIALTNGTEIATGDTSINNRSSNSSNISSRSCKSDRHKSPMCRTEDQENAFRQIEDVHNYSKLNRYGYCSDRICRTADVAVYSSNSSNQDEEEYEEEDDDGEDDEEEPDEDDDDDDVDVDYEKHLHAKVKKLNAIVQQPSDKIVKFVAVTRSPGQDHQQTQVHLKMKPAPVEESVEVKPDEEGSKILPDHHARRPMNAFLIFCKRHRGIVKNKYKNFENRAITKILGEWWASLDTNDKKCYVNLAKQNKDAFFSANPNFKWYKLPAPSLRTLNTRPGNIERQFPASDEYQCDISDSPTQTAVNNNIFNPNSTAYPRNELKNVAYFKLADETQMGELNSLMGPTAPLSTSDALQEAYPETSDCCNVGFKRKPTNSTDDRPINAKRLQSENSLSSSEDDLIPKKSARSCKGKKYQELINSGQISAVIPKKQTSPKPSRPAVSCTIQRIAIPNGNCNKVSTSNNEEPRSPKKDAQSKSTDGQYLMSDSPDSCESPTKQNFSFVSFDLEDKIKALPAQCLDTYLQRKKNTKRKKKINPKKRTPTAQPKTETVTSQSVVYQPKTAQEAKEQVVGSQKRKARKESITRRDINSIQNEVKVMLSSGSVNSNIVVGTGATVVPTNLINATSDLLILAEVAANHTGIAQ